MRDRPARTVSQSTWRGLSQFLWHGHHRQMVGHKNGTVPFRLAVAAIAAMLFVSPALSKGSDRRFTPIVKAAQKAKSSVVSIRGEKTVLPVAAIRRRRAAQTRQRHGHGHRHRLAGLYPHQLPRGGRRAGNPGDHCRRQEICGHRRCPRHRDRSCLDQDRSHGEDAGDRAGHVVGPHAGRAGRGGRQRLRLREHGHRRHR